MSTIEDISAMSKSFDEQQQPTHNNNIASDDEILYPTTKPDVENYALGSLSYDDNIDGSKQQQQNINEDDDYGEADNRGVESLYTDLSCLCIPSCASRPSEICSRAGNWALANADQFISSIIVAISLIPESISYALIAGLPPSSALQSAWIMNIITAMVGGRPGMITSASGLAALLLARLVQTDTVVAESGIMFVPYVIGFAGCLQCVAAFFGWGRLVSSFSPPLVVGMVNAMAVLILVLQCRYAKDFPLTAEEVDNGWNVEGTDAAAEVAWNIPVVAYFGDGYDWISPGLDLGIYFAEVATAFLISMFLPRCTTILPATVVSVMVVAAVEFGLARNFGVETPLIGDYGGAQVAAPWETIFTATKYKLPSLMSWETWKLILGYGFSLFATQFTETAISLSVVDRLDESNGPGIQVLIGQGVANIVSGIMGGMGGSGVVSMSVHADRTFGTTCLSTFMTGLVTFIFITWGYPVINYIPLSAISGISIAMVCSFIQWRSMVATLTACLPTEKRDKLPPQFNIARSDVLIMLFVTTACLIVDIATLLFFVMALGIFVFAVMQGCCCKRSSDEENPIESEEDQEVIDPIPEAPVALEDEDGLVDVAQFPQDMPEDEESSPGEQSLEEKTVPDQSWDCNVLENAERAIFPTKLS